MSSIDIRPPNLKNLDKAYQVIYQDYNSIFHLIITFYSNVFIPDPSPVDKNWNRTPIAG